MRRESWSVNHHKKEKRKKEVEAQEFQKLVEERKAKVARQRRWSEGNDWFITSLKNTSPALVLLWFSQ